MKPLLCVTEAFTHHGTFLFMVFGREMILLYRDARDRGLICGHLVFHFSIHIDPFSHIIILLSFTFFHLLH